MLAIVRTAGDESTGTVSGWVLTAFYSGLLSSPLAVGILVDATGDYDLAWAFTASVFMAAAVTAGLWTCSEARLRRNQPMARE